MSNLCSICGESKTYHRFYLDWQSGQHKFTEAGEPAAPAAPEELKQALEYLLDDEGNPVKFREPAPPAPAAPCEHNRLHVRGAGFYRCADCGEELADPSARTLIASDRYNAIHHKLARAEQELAKLREALVWFGNRSGQFKHYWKQLQSWKDATCTHAEAELVRRDYEKYSEMAALLAAAEAALGEKG